MAPPESAKPVVLQYRCPGLRVWAVLFVALGAILIIGAIKGMSHPPKGGAIGREADSPRGQMLGGAVLTLIGISFGGLALSWSQQIEANDDGVSRSQGGRLRERLSWNEIHDVRLDETRGVVVIRGPAHQRVIEVGLRYNDRDFDAFMERLRQSVNGCGHAYAEGIVHYQEGRWEQALVSFAKSATLPPRDELSRQHLACTWEMTAQTYLQLKRFDDALAAYDKTFWLGHECPNCRFNRWSVLQGLDRVEEAKGACNAFADLGATLARSPEPGAIERWRSGLFDMASWVESEAGGPRSFEQLLQRAKRAFLEGAGAEPTAVQQTVALALESALARYNHGTGTIDAAELRYRSTMLAFDELLRQNPTDRAVRTAAADCYEFFGILFESTGRVNRAEEFYQHALEFREQLVREEAEDAPTAACLGGTWGNLGNVHCTRRQFAQATACYDRAIEILTGVKRRVGSNPMTDGYVRNIRVAREWIIANGSAAQAEPADEGSLESESQVLTRRPPGPPPRFPECGIPFPGDQAGLQAYQEGRFEEALETVSSLLARQPDDRDGMFWKARILGRLGRYEDALQALKQVIRTEANYLPALHDRCDILRYLGRHSEALAGADQLLEHEPRHVDGWLLKGLVVARFLGEASEPDAGSALESVDLERFDEAVDAFDRAILLRPDGFEAWYYKAMTLFHSCHLAQAEMRFRVQVAEKQLTGEALDRYAGAFMQRCRYYFERARVSFDHATKLQPEDWRPWYQKGEMLVNFSTGFETEAVEALTQTLKLRPDHGDAHYWLARLRDRQNDRDQARAHIQQAIALDPDLRDRAREEFEWLSEMDLYG